MPGAARDTVYKRRKQRRWHVSLLSWKMFPTRHQRRHDGTDVSAGGRLPDRGRHQLGMRTCCQSVQW
ncbi:hypothetical protein ACT691_06435, partial [Vibrio metschnikovii]